MGRRHTQGELLVGTGQVEITPPVGTSLAGALTARTSVGVQDPLYARAIVLRSGGRMLAYVILDLIKLYRREGDAAVALASERTGIPPENIVWAASHTHTGPYTGPIFGSDHGGVDEEWLAGVAGKFAEAVQAAHDSVRPARMSRLRAFHHGLSHNRRLTFKDGRAINTWNLARADEEVQSVGAAGPIDPEIGILVFDDQSANPIAVLFHFSLHTNTNFGQRFSADYPAVVA
ncbi:MAG: neutral/alkaline non-lysosomal ceramidase N-terminal domain-containing protein, partial [Candidatus Brocadiaceae bacterium]